MIVPPCGKELARARAAFEREWGAVDEVLYRLCREHPDHSDQRSVAAKIVLVNRAYAAGLERCVAPRGGTQAISLIAAHVWRNRGSVDAIVSELGCIEEPLTADDMCHVVALHGRFTKLLCRATDQGKVPRSFASKYLHFHNACVPIYDSYSSAGATRLVRWDARTVPFSMPKSGDAEYHTFCVRLWRLLEACREAGQAVSMKSIDTYLWTLTWSH